jgi:hypothetical protein
MTETPQPPVTAEATAPEKYVDEHTRSADKGFEGSREHLMGLEVGTVYRGFKAICVEVCLDTYGEKVLKMYPRSGGEPMRTQAERDETVAVFRKVFG